MPGLKFRDDYRGKVLGDQGFKDVIEKQFRSESDEGDMGDYDFEDIE